MTLAQNPRLAIQDKRIQALLIIFFVLTVWWIVLQVMGHGNGHEQRDLLWGACYQFLALLGGIWGLLISKTWGGLKSIMGRSLIAFSVGLLLQTFGQSTFSFYNLYLGIEIPYPSIADIGFFGSIPFYIWGIITLARASGVAFSLRSLKGKAQALILPLVMLFISYKLFLKGYEFEGADFLRVFLDFGYPIGQAVYVSIAALAYTLSRQVLGGVMKGKVLFILFALLVQYIADSNFLFQALNQSWQNGGYGDFIYMLAYFLMAVGLVQLKGEYIRSQAN